LPLVEEQTESAWAVVLESVSLGLPGCSILDVIAATETLMHPSGGFGRFSPSSYLD
jgi:hypothetical protein